MCILGNARTIATALAFAGASALAGAAHADEYCAGVDTELTETRQQEFAGLVAAAMMARAVGRRRPPNTMLTSRART